MLTIKKLQMSDILQEYLNMEIVNLYIQTSESIEVAKKRLETIGLRIGEKLTEKFYILQLFINF